MIRPPDSICTLRAPAKLNLCLEVLGKRADGFHELRSLMATIGLSDTVRVSSNGRLGDIRLSVSGVPSIAAATPSDNTNLVCRALSKLRDAAAVGLSAHASIAKRVPSQAGLGGGSSDAAAALVAGNRVWNLGWSTDRLATLGAELGSDVPFFVHAISQPAKRFAMATGRGELIQPIDLPSGQPVVVVKPRHGLETPAVYRAIEATDNEGAGGTNLSGEVATWMRQGRWRDAAAAMTNHLTKAAWRLAPWLEAVNQGFARCGALPCHLSGSGSACFGLTSSMSEARRVAQRLRALSVGTVFATSIR